MVDIDIRQIADIVREAGTLMDRTGGFEVHDKGARENIVTSSDVAVQHFLTRRLGELLRPGAVFCARRKILPIRPMPTCGSSTPSTEQPIMPAGTRTVASAWRWCGAGNPPWGSYTALGGERCTRRKRASGRSAMENRSTYRKELARSCSDIIYDIYMECNDVRRTGSAAVELCLMAAGFAELYFEMRLMPWDYAAASLILLEAGGAACDFTGKFPSLYKPSMFIAANTREHCGRLLATVRKHLAELPY